MGENKRLISIDELTAEQDTHPTRKSLGGQVLPKDDWWFPSYVPAWARMLPREMYGAMFQLSSATWQFDEMVRRMSLRPRKRGRPRLTDEQEDQRFLLQVEGTKRLLASNNKRTSDVAALRHMFGRKKVGPERARLYRLRKVHKNSPKNSY